MSAWGLSKDMACKDRSAINCGCAVQRRADSQRKLNPHSQKAIRLNLLYYATDFFVWRDMSDQLACRQLRRVVPVANSTYVYLTIDWIIRHSAQTIVFFLFICIVNVAWMHKLFQMCSSLLNNSRTISLQQTWRLCLGFFFSLLFSSSLHPLYCNSKF